METSVLPVLVTAQAQSRFLSCSELKELADSKKQASACQEAAEGLSAQAQSLVEEAVKAAYEKFPDQFVWADSKNLLADITHCLRLITYCLLASSTKPIDRNLLSGLNENNRNYILSFEWYITALEHIKNYNSLTGRAAEEAGYYIEYAQHTIRTLDRSKVLTVSEIKNKNLNQWVTIQVTQYDEYGFPVAGQILREDPDVEKLIDFINQQNNVKGKLYTFYSGNIDDGFDEVDDI